MNVDISTPILQQCSDNRYTVNFCNQGTTVATDVSIEIDLDENLSIVDSEIPIASQSGDLYTFDLGAVAVGECGSFKFQAFLSCDLEEGMTHCTKAEIFPNESCKTVDPATLLANKTWCSRTLEKSSSA